MTIVQKEYLTIFLDEFLEPTNLPDWFTNASPKYKKIIRVLGTTAQYRGATDMLDLPKGIRLVSNLTKDFPAGKFKGQEVPGFNFVMMVNNYNRVKDYNVTQSNLQQLRFNFVNGDGNMFGSTDMYVVIEL
jgi:hypothetical protein